MENNQKYQQFMKYFYVKNEEMFAIAFILLTVSEQLSFDKICVQIVLIAIMGDSGFNKYWFVYFIGICSRARYWIIY